MGASIFSGAVVTIAATLLSPPTIAESCRCANGNTGSSGSAEAAIESVDSGRGGAVNSQASADGFGAADPSLVPSTARNPVATTGPVESQRNAGGAGAAAPGTVPLSAMQADREASLRRTAQRLGLNYDTLLRDGGRSGSPQAEPVGPATNSTDDVPVGRLPNVRGTRIRRAAQLVLRAATSAELQAIIESVAPDPRIKVAFGILNRISTLATGSSRESGAEEDVDELHDEARNNPEELLAAMQEELQDRKEQEELALLTARQQAEIEQLKSQQAVKRAEQALKSAQAAAENAASRTSAAEQARLKALGQ